MTIPRLSEYFLEVVGRNDVVSERVSLDIGSVIIGRAYDCQIIIDDPYVCPQHVKVSLAENGELLIEDLDSVNGLSASRHGLKKAQILLRPGDDCYIGWTKLRYRCRSEKAAPARRDHSHQLVFSSLQQPKPLAIIIVVSFLLLLFNGWLEQVRQVDWYTLVVEPAYVYLILMFWAFVWSIVGKLLVHRALFFTHFAIAAAMVAITLIVEGVIGYGLFMINVDSLQTSLQRVTGFLIIAAMLYAHLHFASRAKPKSQLVAVVTISALVTIYSAYNVFENNDEFSSYPKYIAFLKPPVFVIGSLQTTDEFYSDMSVIERELNILMTSNN